LNQVHYSLIHREIETDGTLDTARELGITIVAYTPLGSGILTGKYHKNPVLLDQKSSLLRIMRKRNIERTRPLINSMDEIAIRHNVTICQVALNWVIYFIGELVVTFPGATKVQQAKENAGAMTFVLSGDELAKLDDISRK
jgi:aryl-alcohol dehydrogenase-like predicted oxidoreductase